MGFPLTMSLAAQTTPNLSFYEVAAQIIPLLFLALLIEERFFSKREDPAPSFEFLVLAAILVGIVGEIVALNALVTGKPASPTERLTVSYAIALLFAPLLWRAVAPRFEALARNSHRTSVGLQLLILVVFLVLSGAAFFHYAVIPVAAAGAVLIFIVAMLLFNYENDQRTIARRRRAREAEDND